MIRCAITCRHLAYQIVWILKTGNCDVIAIYWDAPGITAGGKEGSFVVPYSKFGKQEPQKDWCHQNVPLTNLFTVQGHSFGNLASAPATKNIHGGNTATFQFWTLALCQNLSNIDVRETKKIAL